MAAVERWSFAGDQMKRIKLDEDRIQSKRRAFAADDAPDLATPKWREKSAQADVMQGTRILKRGRPVAERRKVFATIRLDEDVISYFRAGGPGWQTRVNAALRKVIGG
jgi:uncharacterized protein (DUF4415 family)